MYDSDAYGLWSLVVLNSAIFIIFAFSFAKPRTRVEWRTLGGFSAFIVALFTEMYGFPLTIYLTSGWLQSRFPQADLLSHNSGHLGHTLLGWKTDPHWDPLHMLSNLLIFAGFLLLASAWRVLHSARQSGEPALDGPYGRIRHPQYVAFILVMLGFLLQWPTLPTLLMFPFLVYLYVRLAHREEKQSLREFGERYRAYMAQTRAFVPNWRNPQSGTEQTR